MLLSRIETVFHTRLFGKFSTLSTGFSTIKGGFEAVNSIFLTLFDNFFECFPQLVEKFCGKVEQALLSLFGKKFVKNDEFNFTDRRKPTH